MEIIAVVIFLFLLLVLLRKKKVRKTNGPLRKTKSVYRYEYLATLQFRTCLVCGVLDGQRYKYKRDVPTKIHPGCRCVIIPVTALSDLISNEQRPAELIPVALYAEQRYDSGKRNRKFAELSESTQKKYIREEEKLFAAKGMKAYGFFNGNYAQWFASLPAEYQKVIIGDERFCLMQQHHLQLADFVDLKNLREYSIDELYNKYNRR